MKHILSTLILFALALQASAQPLQRVAPEQVGMDSRKLMYADEAIEKAIEVTKKFGIGSGGVPLLTGTSIYQDELEANPALVQNDFYATNN